MNIARATEWMGKNVLKLKHVKVWFDLLPVKNEMLWKDKGLKVYFSE